MRWAAPCAAVLVASALVLAAEAWSAPASSCRASVLRLPAALSPVAEPLVAGRGGGSCRTARAEAVNLESPIANLRGRAALLAARTVAGPRGVRATAVLRDARLRIGTTEATIRRLEAVVEVRCRGRRAVVRRASLVEGLAVDGRPVPGARRRAGFTADLGPLGTLRGHVRASGAAQALVLSSPVGELVFAEATIEPARPRCARR